MEINNNVVMRTPQSIVRLREFIRWLRKQGCSTTKMTIVEVGVFAGDATEIFAGNFEKVYAVDPWESGLGDITNSCDMQEIYKRYKAKTEELWNVETIIDFSVNAAKLFSSRKKKIDIVYIDAMHTYEAVKQDIKVWLPKIKTTGYIAGHDYWKKFPGVIQAVNEMVGKPDFVNADSSWIKKISNIEKVSKKKEKVNPEISEENKCQ